MSNFYEEQLIQAIRRKITPDIMTALRDATAEEFQRPMASVQVPLWAGVDVAFNKSLAAFCVTSTIRDVDVDKWLGGKQLFSTREISRACDKASVIEYLFDEAKKQMLSALAKGELEHLLGEQANHGKR
jgi:hypothetical protein